MILPLWIPTPLRIVGVGRAEAQRSAEGGGAGGCNAKKIFPPRPDLSEPAASERGECFTLSKCYIIFYLYLVKLADDAETTALVPRTLLSAADDVS